MGKTLKSEFIRQYSEMLKPYGFKKIKGRQPYFVRVINNEIIHVITYYKLKTNPSEDKAFRIQAGVLTKYRKNMGVFDMPNSIGNWLQPDDSIIKKKNSFYPDYDNYISIKEMNYNDLTLINSVKNSFEVSKRIINILDEIDNMNSVFEYYMKYNPSDVSFYYILNEEQLSDNESLYYALQQEDFNRLLKETFNTIHNDFLKSPWELIKNGTFTESQIDDWEKAIINNLNDFLENRYSYGEKIIKDRIHRNVEYLRKYDIEII